MFCALHTFEPFSISAFNLVLLLHPQTFIPSALLGEILFCVLRFDQQLVGGGSVVLVLPPHSAMSNFNHKMEGYSHGTAALFLLVLYTGKMIEGDAAGWLLGIKKDQEGKEIQLLSGSSEHFKGIY